MLREKFNDRNDFVLFEFGQYGVPLGELVGGVDFPGHEPNYRQNTISSQIDFESFVQAVTSASQTAALSSVSSTTTWQCGFRETSSASRNMGRIIAI